MKKLVFLILGLIIGTQYPSITNFGWAVPTPAIPPSVSGVYEGQVDYNTNPYHFSLELVSADSRLIIYRLQSSGLILRTSYFELEQRTNGSNDRWISKIPVSDFMEPSLHAETKFETVAFVMDVSDTSINPTLTGGFYLWDKSISDLGKKLFSVNLSFKKKSDAKLQTGTLTLPTFDNPNQTAEWAITVAFYADQYLGYVATLNKPTDSNLTALTMGSGGYQNHLTREIVIEQGPMVKDQTGVIRSYTRLAGKLDPAANKITGQAYSLDLKTRQIIGMGLGPFTIQF